MLTARELSDYQLEALKFIDNKRKCALFMEMGLGKTVTTLTAAQSYLTGGVAKKVLIIAPLRVAKYTWEQEARNWEHLTDLRFSLCVGSKKNRESALESPHDILIVNKENTEWLVRKLGNRMPYDMLVIDESSTFKHWKSRRFLALRTVLSSFKIRILLTGTPAPRSYEDLWSQIYIIDEGARLGKHITQYRDRYFTNMFNKYYVIKPPSVPIINDLIADVCMTIKADDYIKLPTKLFNTEYLELTAPIRKKYTEFKKTLLAQFDNVEIIAANAAVLTNKLLQFCNGNVYDTDTRVAHHVHNLKLQAIRDIIDDNPGENFLIAYNYRTDLTDIKKHIKEAEELNDDTIERWNRGEIRVLCLHPRSAGHGLNLQMGGSSILWYGVTFDLELYLQFNARLHRRGQKNTVSITHIVIKDSIEDKVLASLQSKELTQEQLLNFLKKELTP